MILHMRQVKAVGTIMDLMAIIILMTTATLITSVLTHILVILKNNKIPTISVPTIILRQNQSMITAILIKNAPIHILRLSKIMITAILITNAFIHKLR